MNVSKDALFYAKILLFGEYGIIRDSMGLSIPYNYYEGSLQSPSNSPSETQRKSNEQLGIFLKHLKHLDQSGEAPCALDLEAFEEDLNTGMFFDSTIPQGFGVGSSGALVAAIYDRYAIDRIPNQAQLPAEKVKELKYILGKLESFFHGKSSGIDPLICYLRLPVLIKSGDELGTVELPESSFKGKGAIFLLNSGQPGSTQSMVNIFMEKMKHEGFRNMLKEQFTKYNDACIQAFLKGEVRGLFQNLRQLSQVLLENFSPMIPERFHQLWKQGIDSGDYYLKLCGSGGGGFVLGFTEDYEKVSKQLSDYHPELIQRI